MSKYFGTDGFRGEAGITLTADHAYKVGRFLGWYYNALRERNCDTDPARIVIGKDTSRSSYMFEPMERYFNTLKNECINLYEFTTEEALYQTVEEFAYVAYNHVRPHSFNGYRTPFETRNAA